jgi:uncharacterized protein Yka (UPF0111/DUF47 family)
VTFSLHSPPHVPAGPARVQLFDLFERQPEHIIRAAQLLRELLNNFADARRRGPCHQGSRAPGRSGQVTHEMVKRSKTTFITATADNLLRDSLAALFDEQGDPIEVIKWKEIYETMEIVTDRCEDVANVIEGIILKMA